MNQIVAFSSQKIEKTCRRVELSTRKYDLKKSHFSTKYINFHKNRFIFNRISFHSKSDYSNLTFKKCLKSNLRRKVTKSNSVIALIILDSYLKYFWNFYFLYIHKNLSLVINLSENPLKNMNTL